jgi:hypothetical protein
MQVDPVERDSIIHQLCETREFLVNAVGGVSAHQASYQPGPDEWSIVDCVEHLAAAERLMLGIIANDAKEIPNPSFSRDREEKIVKFAAVRTRRFSAPPKTLPSGTVSLSTAVEDFRQAREATIDFVRDCRNDLRTLSVIHPVLGQMTAMECLLLIITHPLRHAEQIEDVQESPEYPVTQSASLQAD